MMTNFPANTALMSEALPFCPPETLFLRQLGIDACEKSDVFLESLPFSLNDTTAGTESELQAAVIGDRSSVDLSLTIEQSNYYANTVRRALAEDTPRKALP